MNESSLDANDSDNFLCSIYDIHFRIVYKGVIILSVWINSNKKVTIKAWNILNNFHEESC